jgi:hypothetical protein
MAKCEAGSGISQTLCDDLSGMSPKPLRAARANRVFGTEMKRVRTKNTVMDKNNCELDLH